MLFKFFQGHDTTTVGMCWAIFFLGNHPEIQDKVTEELDSIFHDDLDRPATISDISEMKYLERVIKETLRLHPVVPLFSRSLEEDVKIGKNKKIEEKHFCPHFKMNGLRFQEII